VDECEAKKIVGSSEPAGLKRRRAKRLKIIAHDAALKQSKDPQQRSSVVC
jgi:hypothetical protein